MMRHFIILQIRGARYVCNALDGAYVATLKG